MRIFLALICVWGLVGCATATPQSDKVLKSKGISFGPEKAQVEGVPFIEQSSHYCGPATLAMALQWAGKAVRLNEVASSVYTPGMKGSLQGDMITAARRQGMVALPVEGMESLLAEVAAGHPVIVFENLALSWLPQWHYAIVFGYDLKAQEVTLHSGPEAFKKWDLRKFERSWALANYWGMVVLPPNKISATASEWEHVKAAAALEILGKSTEADIAYAQILEHWPNSLGAFIGRANIAYARKDIAQSIEFLNSAVRYHPESAEAWHNLAIAEGGLHREAQARKAAQQAVKMATGTAKLSYEKNLKVWLE